MAYFIASDAQGEFDRRDLTGPITVGRAEDCQLRIRDNMISRHHCRLEIFDGVWCVTDLGSKNGTVIDDILITHQKLSDGDIIHVGQTQISFHVGSFVASRPRPLLPPKIESDPSQNTMAGERLKNLDAPTPQPRLPE